MKKGIAYLLFAMMLVVTIFPTSAFADSKESAPVSAVKKISLASVFAASSQVGLPTVYFVSSKTFYKKLYHVWVKDWTDAWGYCDKYYLSEGRTYTSTLKTGVEGTILDAIRASSVFTQSITYKNGVTVRFKSDPTRPSKLAHYRDYDQYKAVIKYYSGTNGIPLTYGTVLVNQPCSYCVNEVRFQY